MKTQRLTLRKHPSLEGLFMTSDGRAFRELPMSPDTNGYPLVRVDGVLYRRHTLIAETFIGTRPPGYVVRHRNGTPGDDRPSNLRWGTQRQNAGDTVQMGRSTRGGKNAQARLSDFQVREIRARRSAGEAGIALAREFGVSQQTICDIYKRRGWGWLR